MYSDEMINGNSPCYTDLNGDRFDSKFGNGWIKDNTLLAGTTKINNLNFYIIGDSILVQRYYADTSVAEYKKGNNISGYIGGSVVKSLEIDKVKATLNFKVDNYFQKKFIERAKEILDFTAD